MVGRTGFETVTFSVSGRRAPAAPTAQDDESLPDSGSGDVRHGKLRWRAVQVRPGQLVLALEPGPRHATSAATPASQSRPLTQASAAGRTAPWCCCRRTV